MSFSIMDAKTSQFVSAMNSFIDGERRGKNFSNEIESMFSELYDEDERFENLQYALAMFGAGVTIEADEEMLIKELKHAKKIICVPNS
tara:strand:- start:642 stop:905 length:264 start_codon:yes stop_codon:yes gene_type:complete